jgi:hypothetical protein
LTSSTKLDDDVLSKGGKLPRHQERLSKFLEFPMRILRIEPSLIETVTIDEAELPLLEDDGHVQTPLTVNDPDGGDLIPAPWRIEILALDRCIVIEGADADASDDRGVLRPDH